MNPSHLLAFLLCAPATLVFTASALWLIGILPSERIIAAFIRMVSAGAVLSAGGLLAVVLSGGGPVTLDFGSWFDLPHHSYRLVFSADVLGGCFLLASAVLLGVVGTFSVRYLHRDPGFLRFFLLLQLFSLGAAVVFSAGSLDLLIAGWEIIGITSVLLIGFFQVRPDPVRNAQRVFGTYRIADLFILSAVFLAHHGLGGGSWEAVNAAGPEWASVLAVLLVFAASGKSAQGPFCGWLARAMEGPTPSSAVFYGAISVHAGAYLLLRIEPLIRHSSVAVALLVFIGVTTALLTTLAHRTSCDAKTSLAYASQTQLALIFIEIGLGWTGLAALHMAGHAIIRTLQFLRAPSMLHDHGMVHSASGGRLDAPGSPLESVLPYGAHLFLYRIGIGRGFYDAVVGRFVVMPAKAIARGLRWFDRLTS
ncbi:MAG: proton-conducting transporter membrane subunit [Verrucomicrobiota bacterium]